MVNPIGGALYPEISESQLQVSEGASFVPETGSYAGVRKPLHVDGRSMMPATPSTGVKRYVTVQVNVSIIDEPGGALAGLLTTKYEDDTDFPEPDAQNEVYAHVMYDDTMPNGH